MKATNKFKRQMATLLIGGMLTATGCAKKPPAPTAADLYAKGAKAYDAGDRPAAITALEAAVAAEPNRIMARQLLGDAYTDVGNFPAAQAQLEEVVKLDPYGPSSWRKLGVIRHLQGQSGPAAQAYQKALKYDADDWEARMNLGLVRRAQGKTAEALPDLQRATELAPQKLDPWVNYGVGLDSANRPAEAESAYRTALGLKPGDPEIQLNLARTLLAQKKADDAVALLEQIVQKNDSARARKTYGDALSALNRKPEADKQYQLAAKLKQAGS